MTAPGETHFILLIVHTAIVIQNHKYYFLLLFFGCGENKHIIVRSMSLGTILLPLIKQPLLPSNIYYIRHCISDCHSFNNSISRPILHCKTDILQKVVQLIIA